MAADHAVAAAPACFLDHHVFERGNEIDGVLDLMLQVLRERPVMQPEAAAQPIEPAVQNQNRGVGGVAEIREPLGMLNHAVE